MISDSNYSFNQAVSARDQFMENGENFPGSCSSDLSGGNLLGSSYAIPEPRPLQEKGGNRSFSQRHYVQHNYHDHANDPSISSPKNSSPKSPEDEESQKGPPPNTQRGARPKKSRRGPRGGVVTPFPEKLHQMLENVDKEGYADIISWQPHGRCFVMHKPKEFVRVLMPMYFRQTKLTSFQRQLNLYGFCRLTSGLDKCGYYHELFLRGKPSLCRQMMRIRIKGTGIKAASNPETEPNFYSMPQIQPDEINTVTSSKAEETQNSMCSESSNGSKNGMISTNRTVSPSSIPRAISPPESPTSSIVPDVLSFLPPLPFCGPSTSEGEQINSPKLPFQPKSHNNRIVGISSLPIYSIDEQAISFEGKKFHYLDSFVHCDDLKNEDQFDLNRLSQISAPFPRRKRSVTLDNVFDLDVASSRAEVNDVPPFSMNYDNDDGETYNDPMLPVDLLELVCNQVDMEEKSTVSEDSSIC